MKEFKLTCTYAEWKKNGMSQSKELSEGAARMLELTMKNVISAFGEEEMSCEERSEMEKLDKELNTNQDNLEYTKLCHQITDKCLNPTDSEIDYEEIGRLAYKVERMKYPCVLPQDEV